MTTNNIKSLTSGGGKMQLVKKLLNMRYTPDEIISEIAISRYAFNEMVAAGAPIIREGRRIWIHGTAFAEWFVNSRKSVITEIKEKKIREPYPADQVYCTKCRGNVEYVETRREGRVSYGTCSAGHSVSRFTSTKEPK